MRDKIIAGSVVCCFVLIGIYLKKKVFANQEVKEEQKEEGCKSCCCKSKEQECSDKKED